VFGSALLQNHCWVWSERDFENRSAFDGVVDLWSYSSISQLPRELSNSKLFSIPLPFLLWNHRRIYQSFFCNLWTYLYTGEFDLWVVCFVPLATSIRGQDFLWKSQSEWQRTEINGESTSMVCPTLGLRTAEEENNHWAVLLRFHFPIVVDICSYISGVVLWLCVCEFMQQSTPVPRQLSGHLAPFRTFDRRTDDVPKTRHPLASTATNCGSVPKVFDRVLSIKFSVDSMQDFEQRLGI